MEQSTLRTGSRAEPTASAASPQRSESRAGGLLPEEHRGATAPHHTPGANEMSMETTVILGGGFGGIAAANALRRLAPKDHAVVVVDRAPRFHVGAGKTWIMLGERTFERISQARTALLEAGVRFLQADVTAIDIANRKVVTSAETLVWDYLVVALGADLNPAGVPGLADAAHTFYTVAGAERLKTVLEHFSGGDVAILIPKTP